MPLKYIVRLRRKDTESAYLSWASTKTPMCGSKAAVMGLMVPVGRSPTARRSVNCKNQMNKHGRRFWRLRTGVAHFLHIDASKSAVSCRLSRSVLTLRDFPAFDSKAEKSSLQTKIGERMYETWCVLTELSRQIYIVTASQLSIRLGIFFPGATRGIVAVYETMKSVSKYCPAGQLRQWFGRFAGTP